MSYLWMALLVLSPAILYGIALAATAISMRFYRSRCPRCQQRGLRVIDFITATVLINGERTPDHWSDYACEKCGAIVCWHHHRWEPVPEEAARRHE